MHSDFLPVCGRPAPLHRSMCNFLHQIDEKALTKIHYRATFAGSYNKDVLAKTASKAFIYIFEFVEWMCLVGKEGR
jgi:hypothetical protein